ncbi:exported hypothetical protein [uncultured Gammaproteobacteria bacterium]
MDRWQRLFGALVLGVALIAPVSVEAQQAPAVVQPAAPAPTVVAAPAVVQPAVPAVVQQRAVRPREMMTFQERMEFRSLMRNAPAAQRQQIRESKWAELRLRAASQGLRLIEPHSYAPGMRFQKPVNEPSRPPAPPRAP